MRFAIRILGALEITDDDQPVDVTRRQSRQVLGILAGAAGEWVPASVLEADLWPDDAPQSPTRALRTVVTRTRSLFDAQGGAIIEAGADSYRLGLGHCRLDLAEWSEQVADARRSVSAERVQRATEQFAAARRLWRGEPFAGITSSLLLDRERERLNQARVAADLDEAAALRLADRSALAAELLTATRGREPIREDITIATMDALAAAGRHAEGLRLAHDFRQLLRDELGASPSPRFDRAERSVLRGESGPSHKAAPADREWRTDLVDQLADSIVAALDRGDGAHFGVAAPPAYGLSTFLDHVAGRIRDQRRLASVHVVHRRPGREHTVRNSLGRVDDEAATDLSRQHSLLLDLMSSIAEERGLVLVVDDVDQLDHWSSQLLELLGKGDLPDGMALIVAGHADPDSTRADIVLGPLDRGDVETTLSAAIPSLGAADAHRATDRLLDWCGGEPAWTTDAIAAIAAEGIDVPLPVIAEAGGRIAARLDGLDAATRALLRAAATLGDRVDANLLAALTTDSDDTESGVTGSGVTEVVARLGLAASRDLLTATDTPGIWAFTDTPTRDVLAGELAVHEAKHLHARAGAWLAANGQGPARVAHHLVEALPLGDPAETAAAAIAGGHELLAEARYHEAARLFAGAAELAPSKNDGDPARVLHADALERLGDHRRANEIYDDVITRVDPTAEPAGPDLLAEVALGGSGRSSRIGGQEGRHRRLGIAHRRLDPTHPRADEVAAEFCLELLIGGHPIEEGLWPRLLEAAKGDATAGQLLARRLVLVVNQLHTGASFAEAQSLAEMAMRPEFRRQAVYCGASLTVAVQIALVTGEWSTADTWIDELELVGLTTGEPRSRWQSAAFRASLSEARGATAAADELATNARRVGRRLDTADAEATFGLHHLGRALRSGSIAQFASMLAESADRYRFPVWYALRGLAELDVGNEGAAVDMLDQTIRALEGRPDTFRPPALALLCLLGARLDQPERTVQPTRSLEGRRSGMVFLGYGGPFLGPVDWFLSVREAALGNHDSAQARRTAAIEAARRAGAGGWDPDRARAIG